MKTAEGYNQETVLALAKENAQLRKENEELNEKIGRLHEYGQSLQSKLTRLTELLRRAHEYFNGVKSDLPTDDLEWIDPFLTEIENAIKP